eukprot:NODE_21417_length_754_cov_3.267943.p2 GENE.NODE_21417_length_754_cov_3.267943~~NODE_21417_length_754_cov_3.267943.p2  ORF type:complete len:139 (+),score=2.38 NODE_21417_length_754_cov_3.267943:142-558(+)
MMSSAVTLSRHCTTAGFVLAGTVFDPSRKIAHSLYPSAKIGHFLRPSNDRAFLRQSLLRMIVPSNDQSAQPSANDEELRRTLHDYWVCAGRHGLRALAEDRALPVTICEDRALPGIMPCGTRQSAPMTTASTATPRAG